MAANVRADSRWKYWPSIEISPLIRRIALDWANAGANCPEGRNVLVCICGGGGGGGSSSRKLARRRERTVSERGREKCSDRYFSESELAS